MALICVLCARTSPSSPQSSMFHSCVTNKNTPSNLCHKHHAFHPNKHKPSPHTRAHIWRRQENTRSPPPLPNTRRHARERLLTRCTQAQTCTHTLQLITCAITDTHVHTRTHLEDAAAATGQQRVPSRHERQTRDPVFVSAVYGLQDKVSVKHFRNASTSSETRISIVTSRPKTDATCLPLPPPPPRDRACVVPARASALRGSTS